MKQENDRFERLMYAADICFDRGLKAIREAKEWYEKGLQHVEEAREIVASDLGAFDPEQVLRELERVRETRRSLPGPGPTET